MAFVPTGSPHSFAIDDVVVDAGGRRGVVAGASALYALVQWEDGLEEEIEQGDPRVSSEGQDWYEEGGEEYRDDGELFALVLSRFDLWSTAGPRLEEPPHVEPVTEAEREAA
jgi:hypothetical protein